MSTDKSVVVISRRWDNPKINISVTNEGIGMVMSLDKFIVAVGKEMGNPTMLITNKMLVDKLNAVTNVVIDEMKEATKHAV